jgi:hypothetical protein
VDPGAGLAGDGMKYEFATLAQRERICLHPRSMQFGPVQFDLRQLPEPSPPPIKEPPEGPENPDAPVREPNPEEPFQM